MRRFFWGIALILLIVNGSMTTGAQAPQTPAAGRGAGPAAAPTPARPVGVDVATAKKMVAAAEAAAAAANAPVAIAVLDGNGDLVYFERMDGASARAVTSSQGKARAALLFGVPSKDLQEAAAAGKPLPFMITAPPAGAFELTFVQGAVPIIKDGKTVGAIGCGGSSSANDEKFAQAGLGAFTPLK